MEPNIKSWKLSTCTLGIGGWSRPNILKYGCVNWEKITNRLHSEVRVNYPWNGSGEPDFSNYNIEKCETPFSKAHAPVIPAPGAQKHPNSRYQPYIDLLPEDHSCFPINYTKEELELLDGSPFLNMIYEKVIGLKKDYETVIKCDPNFKKYTFK